MKSRCVLLLKKEGYLWWTGDCQKRAVPKLSEEAKEGPLLLCQQHCRGLQTATLSLAAEISNVSGYISCLRGTWGLFLGRMNSQGENQKFSHREQELLVNCSLSCWELLLSELKFREDVKWVRTGVFTEGRMISKAWPWKTERERTKIQGQSPRMELGVNLASMMSWVWPPALQNNNQTTKEVSQNGLCVKAVSTPTYEQDLEIH